jgi:1-acyl-sn-glycerol-3-phosphate acyltransferase
MLGAADTPAEKITEIIGDLYGFIPLHRGSYDRAALDQALDVLKQNGVIGIFPEGGIFEEGKKKALPGIAWLSYRSGAPVLPIGFNDTTGALNAGLNLKRPNLTMHIGQVLSPAQLPADKPRKTFFQEYATQVMDTVHDLIPEEDYGGEPEIVDEWFEIEISLDDGSSIPADLQIQHGASLAKFLHRPAILKIFKVNLKLDIAPLQQLNQEPPVEDLIPALEKILIYLKEENPYLLTYRFGVKGGLEMQAGIEELHNLLSWCLDHDKQIMITPIRHYYSIKESREITQREQGQFESWM